MRIDTALADRMARSTLGHIGREYPNKLDHVITGLPDVARPRALHPIFFGSYDWHSCVHGWWQVMRLMRCFPALDHAAEIRARADAMLTPEKAALELAYLRRPASAGFERPYGWAWLLALHDELARHDTPAWVEALAPLAQEIAERWRAYLPKLLYPVRHGAHANTAFALILSHRWATRHDPVLAALIGERAQLWYGDDRAAQTWEPSGEDFLSPTLCEALLMSELLPSAQSAGWLADFLPEVPPALLKPAILTDQSDGRLAHLDGLNLSRAWCWRSLTALPGVSAAFAEQAWQAAEAHLAASMPHLFDHYMGEHWLSTFALLAAGPDDQPSTANSVDPA